MKETCEIIVNRMGKRVRAMIIDGLNYESSFVSDAKLKNLLEHERGNCFKCKKTQYE